MTSLRPEALTWTGLLAQWVNFAQAALAIPQASEGSRWRESVAPLITLQAVTFALADLDRIDAAEIALALDKAEMLIKGAVGQLQTTWNGEATPESIQEIVGDATGALAAARGNRGQ